MEFQLLSQFSVESRLPTFLEVYVQRRLTETLRDAFTFSLSSAASHFTNHGWLTRALTGGAPWGEEIFLGIMLLTESLFLKHFDATFSESFFGMTRSGAVRRKTLSPAPKLQPGENGEEYALAGIRFRPLTSKQRAFALLTVTLIPYLWRRLGKYYSWLIDSENEGTVIERRGIEDNRGNWMRWLNWCVEKMYPWLHALIELSSAGFIIFYLSDRTPYFAPDLYLQSTVIRRLDQADYHKRQQNADGTSLMRRYQVALMAVIIGLRFLEWWNTDGGRGAVSAQLRQQLPMPGPPVPDPSRTERQVPHALPVPTDGSCPLCQKPVTNLACNIATGVVFCYPCLHSYVTDKGCCPTRPDVRTTVQHIRRLYEM